MNTDRMIASVPLTEEDLDILMDLIKNNPQYKVIYKKLSESHTQLTYKKECIDLFDNKYKNNISIRPTFIQTLKVFTKEISKEDDYNEY